MAITRTLLLKLLYVAVLLSLGAGAVWLIVDVTHGPRALGAGLLALVALVPGGIQAVVFRDLFRGRRLLDMDRPEAAIEHLERFIAEIRRSPYKKRLLWLRWSVYTVDAEAMALNNLGAALTVLGRLAAAGAALQEALTLDSKYPLPHVNLAVLAEVEGDHGAAQAGLRAAAELGYHGTTVDQVINRAQALLARWEGA